MAENSTIEVIKAVGAIVTPIVLAWIAYKQIGLSKKQEVIHGQINGMQEKLIVAEKIASKSEGKDEQRKETKEEEKANPELTPDKTVDVNIVDQSKPVDVKQAKK